MLDVDELVRPYYDVLVEQVGELDLYDAHTHIGHNDPDGFSQTPEQLLRVLENAGARAVVFPMHEPDGYHEANDIAQHFIPEVKRVTRSGPAPNHKPSLLQDYELGRAMEIDVLVKAPAAFARTAGLSTPTLDLIAALAIQKARDKGLYSA